MNTETIKKLKERAKEMLEDNYDRKIGDEEIYTIICELENFYTAYEKEKEKNKEAKNLLIDMVNQFAYEDNKHERLYTGGLSTLEDAFYFLDIDEGIKREDLWKLKEE